MQKRFNVAVVGATGIVGTAILSILAERNFPINDLYALASKDSVGRLLTFKDESLLVQDLAEFDFRKADMALFAAGNTVSSCYVPRATAANCLVIDNSSYFRYKTDVPLVIPEINPQTLADYAKHHIIASPNCSTIQLLVALKPIYDVAGITRVNVATYQSVSGKGLQAIDELISQTGHLLNGLAISSSKVFAQQIGFNLLPQIDAFQENGYTREEMKLFLETQKILQDDKIQVNSTAVRVPVIYGHSEAAHIETRQKITAIQVKRLLQKAPGVTVVDKRVPGGYPTPVTHNSDSVFVGRIREDISHPYGINLWIVADNIRKGAGLNVVQIAELMIRDYL